MKWTIRIELTPDGNPPITYDIGTITRRIADLSAGEIGLTLEEGQQLLRRVRVQIIGSQAHAYALCRRPCVHCGKPKRIKDVRTKCVQTVFGAFRFRGRRYKGYLPKPAKSNGFLWITFSLGPDGRGDILRSSPSGPPCARIPIDVCRPA